MGKICPNCGSMIEDNAKFCDECGNPINFNQKNQSAETFNVYTDEQKVNNVQPQVNVYNGEYMKIKGIHTPVSFGKKVLGIVSLIFGILSILTVGCWFFPEIVAIICGICAKNESGKRTRLGNAGLICGIISILLLILILVIFG